MLAACAEGLGSCWIGFAQRWLETEEGKRAVDLPAGYTPVAPIIVGIPREAARPYRANLPRFIGWTSGGNQAKPAQTVQDQWPHGNDLGGRIAKATAGPA